MAAAQTLPCAAATKADLDTPLISVASPSTWMSFCKVDSNAIGSTLHQPVRSLTPAPAAMAAAFCGGITLATATLYLSKSVTSVIVDGSTEVTLPPWLSGTLSTIPA